MNLQSMFLFALLPLTGLVITTSAGAEIIVESPWVRAAPPSAKMVASYMVLHNNGATAQVLKKITAAGFNNAEIHQTRIQDGIASMEAQDSLSIPPHERVNLAPGGYHLMLIDGDHAPKEGEIVNLSLHFQDGKIIEVAAPVHKDPTAPEGHSHH